MTTILVRCRVADYESWRQSYEQFFASPLGSHVRSAQIWRGQDDPNVVVLAETYDPARWRRRTLRIRRWKRRWCVTVSTWRPFRWTTSTTLGR